MKTLEPDAPQIPAQGRAHSVGCVLAGFHPPSPLVSQAPRRALCPGWVCGWAWLSLSYLRLGPVNMATWPLSGGKPTTRLLQVLLGLVVPAQLWALEAW